MRFLHNNPNLKQRRRELRRSQTDAEKAFWSYVRNRQFYGLKFFRQYSLGPYILDFYCPALRLVIELDGGQHNQNANKEYDSARSEYLKEHRIDVLRFWNNDVLLNIQSVLEEIGKRITPPNLPFAKGEGYERKSFSKGEG
jgi:very-short-patch-repair endonuclease